MYSYRLIYDVTVHVQYLLLFECDNFCSNKKSTASSTYLAAAVQLF